MVLDTQSDDKPSMMMMASMVTSVMMVSDSQIMRFGLFENTKAHPCDGGGA